MQHLRIYIAARYSRRFEVEVLARHLRDAGFVVTSRWSQGLHDNKRDHVCARDDMEDLALANCVLSLTEEPRQVATRGGRHVEFGVGLACGYRLLLVGPRENVFHSVPQVEQFDHFEDMIQALVAEREAAELERSAG